MPIIKLPAAMRDVITSALGNDLGRRIEKGRATAVFTYQCAETGESDYIVEFKRSENTKSLASYHGHSKDAKAIETVPLYPESTDMAQALAEDIHIGDGIFMLRHVSPTRGGEPHDFRVEFTPPGSSAVYLALEAKALPGQSVVMERGDLYPPPGHRFNNPSAEYTGA